MNWEAAAPWVFGLSLLMFVGSLIAIPFLVARIPSDYFTSPRTRQEWRGDQPWLRYGFKIVKNIAGAVFVLAGIAMLVLPGQGLVTIAIGVFCLDFPGKRRLELRIIRIRMVRSGFDWMRRRAGQPPLVIPERRRPGSGRDVEQ